MQLQNSIAGKFWSQNHPLCIHFFIIALLKKLLLQCVLEINGDKSLLQGVNPLSKYKQGQNVKAVIVGLRDVKSER